MAYFPLFIELKDQPVLIVGGGTAALDKARKLLEYGPRLTVIAPEIRPELAGLPGVTPIRRAFLSGDIRDCYVLVIAADSDPVNREAAALCRAGRIPVNVVDTPKECSFFFPSLVRRGPLSIGISTGGASPTAAVHIKNRIDRALPDSTEAVLLWLRSLREDIRKGTRTEAQRKRLYQDLLTEALKVDRPLTPEETEQTVLRVLQGGAEVFN